MKQLVLLMYLMLGSVIWLFGQARVEVRIPSFDEEVNYIWRNIQDIAFFEQNGYQVVFPKLDLIELLKQKAKQGSLSDSDFERLKNQFSDSIYNASTYEMGFDKVNSRLDLLKDMINDLQKSQLDWNFKFHQLYLVQLTLYGPGGSYDPKNGVITLFTTKNGLFKQYDDPACTIIHEIVHMGIEESLIEKHHVPHPLKERIVDQYVLLHFQKILPEYALQDMGDYRIDEFLKEKADLKTLHRSIQQLINE